MVQNIREDSGRQELRPHLRDEQPPDDGIIVVRGGPNTIEKLAAHARRTHDAYVLDGQPFWGISVFCAIVEDCYGLGRGEPISSEETRRREVAVVSVDITCDLMDVDETGYVWTFLHEARDPALVEPGAILVAGDPDAPALAEVVDLVDKPAGRLVHLRVLPGVIADYETVLRRALATA